MFSKTGDHVKAPLIRCVNSYRHIGRTSFVGTAWIAIAATGVGATMQNDFTDRPMSASVTAAFDGNTSSAGIEIDEPRHDGARRKSIWAGWTAPGNGWVTIDTVGSVIDSVVAVYTGDSLASLRPVARNRDIPESTAARVRFPAKQGLSYAIAVDGQYDNPTGSGAVRVNLSFTEATQPAAEVGTDDFASRPELTSGSAALGACNTRYFGLDAFEPSRISERDQTGWWKWTAPGDGTVVIDTLQSDFNTVLTVYAGSTFATMNEVAASRDVQNSTASLVTFQTVAGQQYQIMVDGQNADPAGYGNIVLRLAWEANSRPGAVPGANDFAQRGRLQGRNAEGTAMNMLYDSEAYEPDHGSQRRKTAWWEWTAPMSGSVRIKTEGSDFDTHLVVYQGSSLANLRPVVSNNDTANAVWSEVTFKADRGSGYVIMVDGHSNTPAGDGNIRLSVDQAVDYADTLAAYPAAEVELPGAPGVRYQLLSSENLIDWSEMGEPYVGLGLPIRVLDSHRGVKHRYYRYVVVP